MHDRDGQQALDGVQPRGPQSTVIRLVANQEHERNLRLATLTALSEHEGLECSSFHTRAAEPA